MSFHPSAFDLVNIHLFHDASNLVAWERSPSVYSGTRQKALGYVLDRYCNVRQLNNGETGASVVKSQFLPLLICLQIFSVCIILL